MKLSKADIELIMNYLSIDLSVIEKETGIDADTLYDNVNSIMHKLSQVENGANHIEII